MQIVLPRKSPHVRAPTPEDMRIIRDWLEKQAADGVAGTFLCNWNLTVARYDRGELLAYIDYATGEAVAYQWGGLVQPGILEVRADRRGQGIGQAMVEYRLAEAVEQNEDLLFIQCEPDTSIPFWRRMGFELVEDEQGHTYGFRVLQRTLVLPPDAQPVEVAIEWFPEERKWNPHTPAIAMLEPAAVQTADGDVHLAERVHCFARLPGRMGEGDIVVRISMAGRELYCDKAKYDAAADLGLQGCRNGFFFDGVTLGL